MDQNPLKCTGCHAVTKADGQTVWLCENCGMENQPLVVETTAPMTPPAPAAPPASQTPPASSPT